MKIAVEGCAHGELERIYDTLLDLEERAKCKIDLLICCGDFQATRNKDDLQCMAVPKKYQDICTFYKYYSGEKVAPILTVFVGGNHEASNHLQELPYGGWVAPNIYYLGYAGVVTIGGIRIAGISGIYKGHDYLKGRFECPPYNEETKRSVYHIRNIDVFRLKQMKSPIDIMISHDWPRGVYKYGDVERLLSRKEFFREQIDANTLGSKPSEELLHELKPSYWFAAHLHCKFVSIVPHGNEKGEVIKRTKFLALDKCLPKRNFLQLLEIAHDPREPLELHYDLEWLTILFLTNHLISVKQKAIYMPGPGSNERWKFTPTTDELSDVLQRMDNNLKIPLNFVRTVTPYSENMLNSPQKPNYYTNNKLGVLMNPQTVELCGKLFIDDPIALLKRTQPNLNVSFNNSDLSLPSFLTPDKKEMPSFIDTDTSSITSGMTTIDDDSFSFLTPSKVNRSSLSLPPPKNITLDTSDEERKTRLDFSTEINPDADSEVMSTKDELVEPNLKKFKRRNKAFYSSTEDED